MGYKALRHKYGFGVHSPFAFRMVKDVVCPGRIYSWYGYEDIDAAVNAAHTPGSVERKAKMFHRLIAFLKPPSLFLPLGIDPAFHAAASNVDSRMRIERKPHDATRCSMISSHEDFLPLDTLKDHIVRPGNSLVIMDIPQGWVQALFEVMPEGLMLFSSKNAILVNRPGMMKLAYEILL